MQISKPSQVETQWIPYIAGFLGILLINNALLTMLMYRYDPGIPNPDNLPSLMSSAVVGFALFVSRIVGAIAQPILGYASDQLHSPWGQRRPFLAIAIFPLATSFVLLFMPPQELPTVGLMIYLVLLLCLFYITFAAYQVPYLAWLPRLATTPEQKIRLATWVAAAGLAGSAIGAIGAPWLSQRYGFAGMAWGLVSIAVMTLLLPLTVPETPHPSQDKPPAFWQSWEGSWKNSAFRIYLLGIAAAWIAVSIVSVCPAFLAVALLEQAVSFGGVINAVIFTGTVVGFMPAIYLAQRWGKGRTFQRSMLWLGGGLLLMAVMPVIGGTLPLPWLGLLFIGNLGAASFFILPNAMLPDVIAQGTKQERRDAMYFGTRGLLVEISIGTGSLLAGTLLMLGKTPAHPLGVQLAFPIAGLFACLAAWAFSFYPIQN